MFLHPVVWSAGRLLSGLPPWHQRVGCGHPGISSVHSPPGMFALSQAPPSLQIQALLLFLSHLFCLLSPICHLSQIFTRATYRTDINQLSHSSSSNMILTFILGRSPSIKNVVFFLPSLCSPSRLCIQLHNLHDGRRHKLILHKFASGARQKQGANPSTGNVLYWCCSGFNTQLG